MRHMSREGDYDMVHVMIMCMLSTELNLRYLGKKFEWVVGYLAPHVSIEDWSGDINLEDSIILVII